MTEAYSPNLFLFQNYIEEVVKEGKKHIRTAPFDTVDPENIFANDRSQHFDLYQAYFLAAMGHAKTRQVACLNYEKLLRQALVDKEHLPLGMVAAVLTACANVGGSTSGSSSLGSASLNNSPQHQSLYIGNLVKSILLYTYQPLPELTLGLNYLLEGTRKKHALVYAAMLEQVYTGLLVRFRQPALSRLVASHLAGLVDEVEGHFEEHDYIFASRQVDAITGKMDIPVYPESGTFGKFGRCFICRKEANHYMKDEFVPICSISCKDRVKELLLQSLAPEQFSVLGWVIDNLSNGDQIILSFLQRELQATIQFRTLSSTQLHLILRVLVTHVQSTQLSKPLMGSLTLIVTRWQDMLPLHEVSAAKRQHLQNYLKTFYLEVLGVVEELPVAKQQLDYINFFSQILRHEPTFVSIFNRYDCRFYQPNILARMLNILSQYARKFENAVEGLHLIVKMLSKKYVEHTERVEHWPFAAQCMKKRELKKAITLFNKKPLKGIAYFKKIFENVSSQEIKSKEEISELESPIKSYQDNSQEVENSFMIKQKEQLQRKETLSIQTEKKMEEVKQKLEAEHDQDQQYVEHEQSLSKQKIQDEGNKAEEVEKIEEKKEFEEEKKQKQQEVQIEKEVGKEEKEEKEQPFQQPQAFAEQIVLPVSQEEIHKTESIVNQIYQGQKERIRVTPLHIALFLRQFTQPKSFYPADHRQPINLPLLSQTAVGEYFGLNNEQAREVSHAYLSTFDFQGYEIDDMMRIVLNSFSLPKETQMVDRIIGDIAKRLVGLYGLNNDTQSYQYFYLLLMVQTTNHNPNVRESERLKLDSFLKMCFSMIGRIPDKAEADYNRILEHPLNLRMKYSDDSLFHRKYLKNLDKQTHELFGEGEEGSQARHLLLYIWQYLVIGLVWPGNSKGLQESVILLGRQGLAAEQRAFFEALRKEGPQESSRDSILKIGIEFGNQLHGDLWNTVISLIYKLQNENEFNSAVLDKLFTNSGRLQPLRLRDFLRALLQFSKSDIKQDSLYTRELFVLRHINSLLQYNIPRFVELAAHIWPLLQDYFRDICLHPRREVSMAAVDSLKQLVLKLLKLHQEAVPHEALMETFLHIFERSCLEMKDLIANVLLNLITVDLRDGWQAVYQILDRLDTKDKHLVTRILGRLIGEIGLARLTNLSRLHAICIKQLRICSENEVVEQLLAKLWELSQFINDATIWLETIKSILDTFKKSLNNDLLQVFIRMCNRCLAEQQRNIADKQIFNEIVDLLMFLTDLKGSQARVVGVLLTSLESFKQTDVELMVKYLGGSYGFLSNFQLFLSTEVRLPFAVFMKSYFIEVLLPALRQPTNQLQFEQFSQWCINQYYDNLPLELINLKEKDKDFEKTLGSLQAERKEVQKEETELIEFHLSHKQYKEKSTLHLIFLEIVQQIYKQSQNSPRIRQKIEESVVDSYECAFRINKYILLRNFLWKNGFLSSKHLPGLHKQEHRTFSFIIKEFPFTKIYPVLKSFLKHYLLMTGLLHDLKRDESQSGRIKAGRKPEQKDGRNLHIYIADAQFWLNQAHRGVCSSWQQIRWQLNTAGVSDFQRTELNQLINLSLSLLSLKALPAPVCNETSDTLKLLYQLLI